VACSCSTNAAKAAVELLLMRVMHGQFVAHLVEREHPVQFAIEALDECRLRVRRRDGVCSRRCSLAPTSPLAMINSVRLLDVAHSDMRL
jgi:hypothetical protein